jgi:hypothetical protein
MADEPMIVQAVGTSVGHGDSGDATLADRIQAAMTHAVLQALADGVPMDATEEILRRKMQAREDVLNG